MEYRVFGKISFALTVLVLVASFAGTAQGYAGAITPYNTGFWGPFSGPRECDATNVDGICIAWHSTLKGASMERLSQCTPWKCDLRSDTRPRQRAPQVDDSWMQQLSVEPHAIEPAFLDAQAKPVKAASHETPVHRPADTRAEHGPIKPLVIEVR